ncbi:MAG: peptidase [Alphaproteobacteria bacterium]|nr:peptidase [Alphaproteobacteria bacterium]
MRNKFLAGILGVFLLAQPARAQVFYPESATLKNGLQVVVLPNHRAPVVTHMLWFKAGAMDDPWGVSGIAHFLEHLMFKGTKLHPEGDYSKIISRMGGEENAMTTYDFTAYYATVGKEYLEEIIQLESDRLANWQVTDEQVARERQVILKERQQRTENDPVAAFFENVNALLYTNYPYQRPVIGWRSEMEKLSRTDAENFVKTHYAPNNAILVVSGDVTLADVTVLAEKYYGKLPPRDIPKRAFGETIQLESRRLIESTSPLVKETIWSRHRLVPPARPQNIADSDALLVLDKILGDNRIGRLYRRLVVKDKIATSASISFDPDGIGPQRFALAATPAPDIALDKIEQAMNDEIDRLVTLGVSEDEVKKAAGALEIEAVYARDSVMGPAMAVGSALTSGLDLATIEAWPKRMQNVTKAQVDKAAKELFASKDIWVTAILHPAVEAQP